MGSKKKDLRKRGLVDKLLLAIIVAHPSKRDLSRPAQAKELARRLAAARRALLNEKSTSRGFADFEALEFMARELVKDRDRTWWRNFRAERSASLGSGNQISARKLAKLAVHLADGIGTPRSIEDRLRTRFAEHKNQLLDIARQSHKSDANRLTEEKILEQIAVLLAPYLEMKIVHAPKRQATFASGKRGKTATKA